MLKVLLFALLAGCTGDDIGVGPRDDTAPEVADTVCPVILHTPITETQTFGADITITAEVSDDTRVTFVTLHYKTDTDGSGGWQHPIMAVVDDVYTGTIKGTDHSGSGMDYYIEATDPERNTCFLPEEGAQDPYHFRIAP